MTSGPPEHESTREGKDYKHFILVIELTQKEM